MNEPSASSWAYFPVFLRLRGQRVLVVGGGEVAARKIRLLTRAGAAVMVVAADLCPELQERLLRSEIRRISAAFDPVQLDGCRLVIAATDDAGLNQRVAAAAEARRLPVNVVDDVTHSSFVTPSIVDRAPLLIAISSFGAAPVLARRVRERIEAALPTAYGRVASFMLNLRERVKQQLPQAQRRGLWERFLDGGAVERLLSGDEPAAQAEFERLLAAAPPRGEVYLVGAGPGDPDLLTLRALRLMQQCDVVLYDRLISPAIMELVRRDAERIFVGKKAKLHTVPQDEINQELVRLAQAGKRVLRLKGGDPFIFGRGGEEIETLAAAGVAFQVVPGITAASGCATYAGIPLTHRDYAQTCIFVTGHPRKDGTLDLHWDQLARRGQTVAIYMGRGALPQLCAKLIEHGLPPEWPAALIEDGTCSDQRVLIGTLADLPLRAAATEPQGAGLVIVGEVVRLRERLQWYQPG